MRARGDYELLLHEAEDGPRSAGEIIGCLVSVALYIAGGVFFGPPILALCWRWWTS